MKLAVAIEHYTELKKQNGYEFVSGQKALEGFVRRTGDVELEDVTKGVIGLYLAESDSAGVYWQAKYRILDRFFNYWSNKGAIRELTMPAKKPIVRSTFVPYIFSRHEIRELLKAARRCHHHNDNIEPQTMRTIILLLYGLGALTSEITRLRCSDVNLRELRITISGRGVRHRQIPIGESLANVLHQYVVWRGKRKLMSTHFLITKWDQPVKVPLAMKYFEKIRTNTGIVRLDSATFQPRMTDLRYTFAVHRISSWIRNGADLNRMLPALAAYMGQPGLGATEKYLALTPARFQKQLDKLSPERRRFHWRNDPVLMNFLSSL